MRGTEQRPEGLLYRAELVTPAEERELVGRLRVLELAPVTIQGQSSRRLVRHFGVDYDFDRRSTAPADEPIPAYLLDLRRRCAALAEVAEESLVEGLVTRYPEGAGIGWHRDAPPFGSHVIGVSLVASCVLQFQRRSATGKRLVYQQALPARSAYVLSGPARYSWQHRIPAVDTERWSVTFRQIRSSARPA